MTSNATTTTGGSEAAPASASARLTPRLRLILAIVLLADVLDLMDSTITNIAAPTIVRDIGGGESLIKWLGASYALAMGVLLVVGARLGDRYGKRRMFLVGIAGFTLASLAAGLAVDPVMLITARLAQGGFGALLIPQGIGLLIASFNREQMRGAFSAFGPVMGASAILGPILAGFIISANIGGLTWRPIFLINIVLGAVGFIAALRVLPADERAGSVFIDSLGAGLLGASMLGLVYGLIEGSTDGWTALPIGCLAAGAALLAAFGVRQRTAADPLILPSLLANRGFTAGMLLGLAFFAAVNGLAYVISLFFQTGLGMSARAASIALSPFMIGIIVASFACRPLLGKLGRTMVAIGIGLTLAGAAGVWATVLNRGVQVNLWTLAPSILVLGVGAGACFSSLFDVAIGDVAPAEAGSASGSLSAVQQLASAIGSAVVTTVYFSQRLEHGAGHAMTASVAVVALIAALGLGLVWLLPRSAPAGTQ
ncbi:MAG TPA: MFS transporter [Trebonia sp.]|nr:MFS transporter [Trebonia sp.]